MGDDYDDDARYDRYDDDYERPKRRRRRRTLLHSGPGIVSTALGVLAILVIFLTIVAAGAMAAKNDDLPDNDPRIITVGAFVLAGAGLAVVGGILGLVGVLVRGRNKLFAAVGLSVNGCVVLGVVLLCILGALAG